MGGIRGGKGKGGEMTKTLYAHMNKKKKTLWQSLWLNEDEKALLAKIGRELPM
jgi:hypothetical protein